MRPMRYDAIICGARCAGAATAMLLARAGMRVLVVDRGRYGTDTLSTHALMRGGVFQLKRWGLLERLIAAGTPPIRTTSFHYADETVDIEIKPADGVDALYAPRRTVLDRLLVDAAREAGAEIRYETKLLDVVGDPRHRVRGVRVQTAGGAVETIEAGVVIGADGLRSTVARRVGARRYRTARHCTGVIYGYRSGLPNEGFHWYYRPGVSAGMIPTNDGNTCVFVSAPPERLDAMRDDVEAAYRRVLAECDASLARRVAAAPAAGKLFSFAGTPGYLRRSWGPGWALVGDAGYFKDPLTAHGITDALRDAELLARAVLRGSTAALEAYETTRDLVAAEFLSLTDDIASFSWDLEQVRGMHLELSRQMNAEVRALRELDGIPAAVRRSA